MSLLYQLPEDGSWVRFSVLYTFKSMGVEQSGRQMLKMASVGKAFEEAEECRWLEFNIQTTEEDTAHFWIRKLLIPVKYLKRGENPTLHIVRGWTLQEDRSVEPAVPIHGRWPAFLAGPLQDEQKLPQQVVDSAFGRVVTEGVTGWIQFHEGTLTTSVTFETRLYQEAPFGVVSPRMVFEVTGDESPHTIDTTLDLIDFGKGARSELPDYN
jgi:hypothetical protein